MWSCIDLIRRSARVWWCCDLFQTLVKTGLSHVLPDYILISTLPPIRCHSQTKTWVLWSAPCLSIIVDLFPDMDFKLQRRHYFIPYICRFSTSFLCSFLFREFVIKGLQLVITNLMTICNHKTPIYFTRALSLHILGVSTRSSSTWAGHNPPHGFYSSNSAFPLPDSFQWN